VGGARHEYLERLDKGETKGEKTKAQKQGCSRERGDREKSVAAQRGRKGREDNGSATTLRGGVLRGENMGVPLKTGGGKD